MPAPKWVWRAATALAVTVALFAAHTHAFIVWDEIMALLPASLFTNTDGYVVLGAPTRATTSASSPSTAAAAAAAAPTAPIEDCDAPAAAAAARALNSAAPLAAPPVCTSSDAPIPGEGGCRDCNSASAAASAAVSAALAEFAGPCAVDADCAAVWADVQCYGSCSFPARATAVVRAREAIDVISRRFCGGSVGQGRAQADRLRAGATPLAAPGAMSSLTPATATVDAPSHLRAYALWPVATYMRSCPYMTPMCAAGRPVCRTDPRFDATSAREGACGGAAWARDTAGRYARRCVMAHDDEPTAREAGLPVAVLGPEDG